MTKYLKGTVALALLLSMLLLCLMLPAGASKADELEDQYLGTLSASFEASGPHVISGGVGDPGGKSYGSYQLASNYDKPKDFFNWCQTLTDNDYYVSVGQRLKAAYDADVAAGKKYADGCEFDKVWRQLAAENSSGFEQVQRKYARGNYYDRAVEALEANHPGFLMSNYSIALRNVIWSRAVQLGVGGIQLSMRDSLARMNGYANYKDAVAHEGEGFSGFKNQSEAELIDALYYDSSEARPHNPNRSDGQTEYAMTGPTAQKYGLEGMSLSWFWGASSDVQLGVYNRLGINEPAKAHQMLANYGYLDALVDEGDYILSPSDNQGLAIIAGADNATLNTRTDGSKEQTFRLTYYASGYYTVTNVVTGQRLTASGGAVTMANASADNAQMWQLERFDTGYALKNRASGTYLQSGTAGSGLTLGETAVQWQLPKANGSWTLRGASYPQSENPLFEGNSSFTFCGTLRCGFNIKTVTVRVLNSAGEDAFAPATAAGINAKFYDLKNLDSQVAFSRLKAGRYTLTIDATSDGGGDYHLESSFSVIGTYTITFVPGDGSVKETSRVVEAGQSFGELPTAALSGHFFVGWYTAAEGGEQVSAKTIVTESNKTVYARYEKGYTATFQNYDGGHISATLLHKGDAIVPPTKEPTRSPDEVSYYTFRGWEGYENGMTIAADIVFKAVFDAYPLEGLEEITTSAYTIQEGYLRKISTNTDASTLLELLVPKNFISIHKDGTAVTGKVGTGMTVDFTVPGEEKPKQSLTVVVTGDTNGDGACDIIDVVQMQSLLVGKTTFSAPALSAADLNGDGTCDIIDMVQVIGVLVGKNTLTPN